MRLEKIVLNGFKSFADKTEFPFNSPITAIVGPNGCGKSNVVDAVKWVLGEQSVKSLRSGQMADVIFSGSSSRKPMGTAEVSLFITNLEGNASTLPIEASHIQITRRIYKNGESEYRINNKICRLKDIRELFMDTGVGTKAYSIIEQGQIEQLLSASKIDRRAILEEAAGISKYKAHKQEALRKLERTEQNLLRLADILGEVTKSLRSVKYQAGKARNYLQYRDRLKQLQANYSLAEYAKIATANAEKKTALEKLEQEFSATANELAKQSSLSSKLGEEIIETENKLNQTENRLVAVQSKIEQSLQRIEFLRERITELQQRRESARQRVEQLQERQNTFVYDLAQYTNEKAQSEKMLKEESREAEQIQKDIEQVNKECTALEAGLEDEKSGIIDIVRRTAQLHNEIQSTSIYRNNLSNQKDRLTGRANTTKTELEKVLTEKAQYQTRLNDIEKVLAELKESLDSKRKQEEETKNSAIDNNEQLAHKKEVRSAMSRELVILTDMETRGEGLNSAVKHILANRSNDKLDYVEGILADIISADVKYANAFEAALEGKTDAVVVNNTSKLLADTETIEKLDGRVNFLCADKIEPFVDKKDLSKLPGIKGRAVEFVRYNSKHAPLVWKLLGKTLIIDSIDAETIELSEKIGHEYKFVTLEGEFLSPGGTIKLGPAGKTTGLISRKSRVNQLQETIKQTSSEIAALEKQISKSRHTQEHLDKLCRELRTAIYEANTEKMQINSKLIATEENIKRLREEQPLIAGEIDQLEEQIAQSVQKEYDSKQKLQELETVNKERTAHIKELEEKYTEQKEQQQLLVS
ncbi:MAG: chromosome segregation protein SMC, partial [Planctomycetota bacterium]